MLGQCLGIIRSSMGIAFLIMQDDGLERALICQLQNLSFSFILLSPFLYRWFVLKHKEKMNVMAAA